MSASPGAVVTSLPQQTWIKIAKGKFLWYVYGTFTSSTSYVTIPPWHELPLGVNQYGGISTYVQVVVTAVSGTSPAMTINVYLTDTIAYLNGVPYWSLWYTVPSSGSITSTGYYGNYGLAGQLTLAFQISISVSGTSPSFTAYIEFDLVG